MCILNSEGCNIFEHFSHESYKEMLDLVQYDILSTDLAHHLRIMKEVKDMATGEESPLCPKDRQVPCLDPRL